MPVPLNRVEIEGTAPTLTVKVDGHMLACSSAVLNLDAEKLPVLTVDLPALGGVAAALDGVTVQFAEASRDALIAMGWTPPEGEEPAVA